MSKFTEKEVVGLSEVGLGLDELVRHGARQVIQQAIEAELSALLERFENVKTIARAARRGAQRLFAGARSVDGGRTDCGEGSRRFVIDQDRA